MFEELKKKKKGTISPKDIVNAWLVHYFGKTYEEVEATYKDENGVLPADISRQFYQDYALTKEQYEEYELALKEFICKKFNMPKKRYDRDFGLSRLNIDPSIKHEQQ